MASGQLNEGLLVAGTQARHQHVILLRSFAAMLAAQGGEDLGQTDTFAWRRGDTLGSIPLRFMLAEQATAPLLRRRSPPDMPLKGDDALAPSGSGDGDRPDSAQCSLRPDCELIHYSGAAGLHVEEPRIG